MLKLRILLVALLLVLFVVEQGQCEPEEGGGGRSDFVCTSGTHFIKNGRSFYLNGFNSYWLMDVAYDPAQRVKVTSAFQDASMHGMNVARTWAFSDGGSKPMQSSPGVYSEVMFKTLDFVISEAKKHGVYLILSFGNNWNDYGGRRQYVEWGKEHGQYINKDDEFYTNPMIKSFFKNHIKAVLTGINSITDVAYKDDPTIFAWELMNEPRCQIDLSGKSLQGWVTEMATYEKSIDNNHLLEIGLEGFYGESMPEQKQFNPGYQVGTDFISNNQIPQVDFATVHLYLDQWVGSDDQAQNAFVEKWVKAHIQDSNSVLRKPVVLAEFGKSSRSSRFSIAQRDAYFGKLYDFIYDSAKTGGSCAGGLFWHVMAQGMENYSYGYEVVLAQNPSTTSVTAQQSRKMSALN